MITIKIQDKSIDFPESWAEIKLKQFISFMKWLNNRPQSFQYEVDEIVYNLNLIRIFALNPITDDDINSLDLSEISPLLASFDKFIGNIPDTKVKESLIIDGVLYSFKSLDSLSIGEYISYRQLLETKEDKLDVVPDLLSIICRPATKRFCTERKKDVFDLSPFKAEDIKWRREIMENAPALELMSLANFFLSGSLLQTNNSTGSLSPKKPRKTRKGAVK